MNTHTHGQLSYQVIVSDGVTRSMDLRLPDGQEIASSPISSTLIYGERDAVLVDPPLTHSQIAQVADGIDKTGKRLDSVYITHGHPDHWFGTAALIKRFGDSATTVYATKGTITQMHQQLRAVNSGFLASFPGQIPEHTPVLAQPVPAEGFALEGHVLRAVETGHTDTEDSTVLHVPSLDLVVAGDVVYNGVHQMMLEGSNGGLRAWLDGIDVVQALSPRHVVAGHKNKDLPDDPRILDETRQYLHDAIHLLEKKVEPLEFFQQMTRLHADRLNPGPLWYSALGLLT